MRNTPDFADLYMPFDHLFFFSDRGNGDLIDCRALKSQIDLQNVYRRVHLFADFEEYVVRSLSSEDFD